MLLRPFKNCAFCVKIFSKSNVKNKRNSGPELGFLLKNIGYQCQIYGGCTSPGRDQFFKTRRPFKGCLYQGRCLNGYDQYAGQSMTFFSLLDIRMDLLNYHNSCCFLRSCIQTGFFYTKQTINFKRPKIVCHTILESREFSSLISNKH